MSETMSKPSFTPGPWTSGVDGYVRQSGESCNYIKLISPWLEEAWKGDSEAISNAHLIAAAPSLYDALDLVMREIVGDDFEGNTDIEKKAVKDAWSALKQARGETP